MFPILYVFHYSVMSINLTSERIDVELMFTLSWLGGSFVNTNDCSKVTHFSICYCVTSVFKSWISYKWSTDSFVVKRIHSSSGRRPNRNLHLSQPNIQSNTFCSCIRTSYVLRLCFGVLCLYFSNTQLFHDRSLLKNSYPIMVYFIVKLSGLWLSVVTST